MIGRDSNQDTSDADGAANTPVRVGDGEDAPSRAAEFQQTGAETTRRVSSALANKLRGLWERDPQRLGPAVEMGLLDRAWLEDPDHNQFRTSSPGEMIERYLERSSERLPGIFGTLSKSALALLTTDQFTGEPRTEVLTIAFTDLEGFTSFTATEGDDAASYLLESHYRMVGGTVRSRGGKVVKRLGDGLLLAFGDPEAAVRACVELVEQGLEPVRVRAGVHLGEVRIAHRDVLGHTVNVASRVCDLANGGELLATVAVRDAVGHSHGLSFSRARNIRAKGLEQRLSVVRITSTKPGPTDSKS